MMGAALLAQSEAKIRSDPASKNYFNSVIYLVHHSPNNGVKTALQLLLLTRLVVEACEHQQLIQLHNIITAQFNF